MKTQMLYAPAAQSRITSESVVTRYKIPITGAILDSENYDDVLDTLEKATLNDTVIMRIDTVGGYKSTMIAIADAMDRCQGTIIGWIIGDAYSAGSFLAMHCHQLIVADGAEMMIHTIQTGYDADAMSMKGFSDHVCKVSEKLLRKDFANFLTDAEIDRVIHSEAIWLTDEDIRKRWKIKEASFTKDLPAIPKEEVEEALETLAGQLHEQADIFHMSINTLMTELVKRTIPEDNVIIDNDTESDVFVTEGVDTNFG